MLHEIHSEGIYKKKKQRESIKEIYCGQQLYDPRIENNICLDEA